MNILIVDDDELTCLGMRKWILDAKMADVSMVMTAASAEDAMERLKERRYQVLITDIQMVEMDGLQLIERAKRLHPGIVSIIITAYASFPYAHQAIKLGVKSFLLKPFGRDELQSALREAMDAVPREAMEGDTDPIAWAKTFVREHLDTEANMASVANELNLSYTYFSKLFKQQTGKSFQNYVIEAKMREAAKLLLRKKSIAEIAERLGYTSQQNFSRAFGNFWGESPNSYRKRQEEEQ